MTVNIGDSVAVKAGVSDPDFDTDISDWQGRHATIAAGVLLGELAGDDLYSLETAMGEVPVEVRTKGAS